MREGRKLDQVLSKTAEKIKQRTKLRESKGYQGRKSDKRLEHDVGRASARDDQKRDRGHAHDSQPETHTHTDQAENSQPPAEEEVTAAQVIPKLPSTLSRPSSPRRYPGTERHTHSASQIPPSRSRSETTQAPAGLPASNGPSTIAPTHPQAPVGPPASNRPPTIAPTHPQALVGLPSSNGPPTIAPARNEYGTFTDFPRPDQYQRDRQYQGSMPPRGYRPDDHKMADFPAPGPGQNPEVYQGNGPLPRRGREPAEYRPTTETAQGIFRPQERMPGAFPASRKQINIPDSSEHVSFTPQPYSDSRAGEHGLRPTASENARQGFSRSTRHPDLREARNADQGPSPGGRAYSQAPEPRRGNRPAASENARQSSSRRSYHPDVSEARNADQGPSTRGRAPSQAPGPRMEDRRSVTGRYR